MSCDFVCAPGYAAQNSVTESLSQDLNFASLPSWRSEVLWCFASGAGYIAGYTRPGIVSKCPIFLRGEVAERLKAAVLKIV